MTNSPHTKRALKIQKEMAQQLRVHTALAEGWNSVPSTMSGRSIAVTPAPGNLILIPVSTLHTPHTDVPRHYHTI